MDIFKKAKAILFGLAISLAASATAADIDLGELQLDTDYVLSDSKSTYVGTFVAPASGTLKMYGEQNAMFTDEACTSQLTSSHGGWGSHGQFFKATVSEGETYYFKMIVRNYT